MTQRVFDMENEQDVKDLFDILPDKIDLITNAGFGTQYHSESEHSSIDMFNMFKINFGKKLAVPRPVDKSKWIGCLVWLWDNDENEKTCDILADVDERDVSPYKIISENGFRTSWENCRPVKRSEIKFVEDND